MLTVIGVQQKQGEYQGKPYNNYILHCTKEDESGNSFGVISEQVKVKASKVVEIFGHTMTPSDWDELVGKEIRVFYNKYGTADEVRIIEG